MPGLNDPNWTAFEAGTKAIRKAVTDEEWENVKKSLTDLILSFRVVSHTFRQHIQSYYNLTKDQDSIQNIADEKLKKKLNAYLDNSAKLAKIIHLLRPAIIQVAGVKSLDHPPEATDIEVTVE